MLIPGACGWFQRSGSIILCVRCCAERLDAAQPGPPGDKQSQRNERSPGAEAKGGGWSPAHPEPAAEQVGRNGGNTGQAIKPAQRRAATRAWDEITDKGAGHALGSGVVDSIEREKPPRLPALRRRCPAHVDEGKGGVADQQHRQPPPAV